MIPPLPAHAPAALPPASTMMGTMRVHVGTVLILPH